MLRAWLVVVATGALLAGCGGGSDIDWTQEGESLGRGLVEQGQARTAASCERAVSDYARDVGLPTGDDLAVMRRGCEQG